MSDAVLSLRQEIPALGLTAVFSPPRQRPLIADGLLLWIETRRASLASENLVAATRLTWWRDALADGKDPSKTQGVPLAERLIKHDGAEMLAEGLDATMIAILHGETEPIAPWCEVLGRWFSRHGIGQDFANAAVLKNLDAAFAGQAAAGRIATGQPSLDLISWCCLKPSRLNYPEQHPLLAVQMLLAAMWPSWRKPSSG